MQHPAQIGMLYCTDLTGFDYLSAGYNVDGASRMGPYGPFPCV